MKNLIVLFILAVSFIAAPLSADMVYLKNGRRIEGIIAKEDERSVELNMGFGTVTFQRLQIKNIKRSSFEDSSRMVKKWEEKRMELENKAIEFDSARDQRFKEAYESSMEDARAKKLKEEKQDQKNIQMMWDQNTRSVIVEVLLNEKVKTNLVLDTGASLVILSRRVGNELGLDLADTKNDVLELTLADGRRSSAKAVILDSVRIQGVERKHVMAAVMLDQQQDADSKDGLLGMSFLNNFNLKMDLKNMKMTLEKLENEI